MEKSDKNIHKNHRKRLRERFEREGADSFELHELLELFLFDAIPRVNTNPIAHRLLDRFGDLDGVFSASKEELMSVKGIGERAAEYIINASEEQRRQIDEEIAKMPKPESTAPISEDVEVEGSVSEDAEVEEI